MKSDYYATSRRDFLKTSVLGSAAALTPWQLGSAETAAAPAKFIPSDPVNSPMGTAFGVKPGRVAWAFDAKATTWDGENSARGWWDDTNTHPELINPRFAYVSVSRAAQDAQIYTNAASALTASLSQAVTKTSAIDMSPLLGI